MLKFSSEGPAVAARDAATLVLVRDAARSSATANGIEVFCVERHKGSGFMGGAIVFPGGKLDPADKDDAWASHATGPLPAPFAPDPATARALAIAACRETLEEATMLPALPPLGHEELLALRTRMAAKEETLFAFLAARGVRLDLARLVPFCRWITPERETRRFDTRFYLAIARAEDRGAHDDHETTASFWASPAHMLARFDAGEVQVLPPTHRTLALLSAVKSADEAAALAMAACKEPICPVLVKQKDGAGETLALALPGDPQHAVREARVPGASRFVLRGERWLPENAPPAPPASA